MSNQHTKYKNRLLKLAAFLDELPRKRFYYSSWVGSDWKGKPDLSCGTTACALGWATTMPMFRRLGLRLYRYDSESMGEVRLDGDRVARSDGMTAAEELFGVSFDEARFLFSPGRTEWHDRSSGEVVAPGWVSPSGSGTPKQVARHIRRFVAWKWPAP